MQEPLDILNSYLQDEKGVLTEEQKQNLIEVATTVVLNALPHFEIEEVAVEGKVIELPSKWDAEISFIDSVWDSKGNYYRALLRPDGKIVLNQEPEAETVFCRYACRPDELTNTQKYLVGVYATYLALLELANYYIQTIDPTLSADSVNYRNKADICEKRAEGMLKLFERVISQVRGYL